MRARRLLPAAALALVAVSATGCQNPFDPSGDVRLIQWEANAGTTAQITQSLATGTLGTKDEDWKVQRTAMHLGNFSSVGVLLTSYVVVYRQIGAQDPPASLPPGSPIPSLGGAGGRRYPINIHVRGLENNSTVNTNPYAGTFEL